jgi:hypothetical protein
LADSQQRTARSMRRTFSNSIKKCNRIETLGRILYEILIGPMLGKWIASEIAFLLWTPIRTNQRIHKEAIQCARLGFE